MSCSEGAEGLIGRAPVWKKTKCVHGPSWKNLHIPRAKCADFQRHVRVLDATAATKNLSRSLLYILKLEHLLDDCCRCACVRVCVHACSMGFWELNLEPAALSRRYSPPELALTTASSTPPSFSLYLHFLRHGLTVCKTDLEFVLVCQVAGITNLWHQP